MVFLWQMKDVGVNYHVLWTNARVLEMCTFAYRGLGYVRVPITRLTMQKNYAATRALYPTRAYALVTI
jgi:hypothetical protein